MVFPTANQDIWHETCLAVLVVSSIAAGIYVVLGLKFLWDNLVRPHLFLTGVPGPSSGGSLFHGQMRTVLALDSGVIFEQWREQYGNIFQYDWFLSVSAQCLCSTAETSLLSCVRPTFTDVASVHLRSKGFEPYPGIGTAKLS